MPGRAHVEEFATARHFARHVQPARGRNVNADEIDLAVGDQRQPLVPVVRNDQAAAKTDEPRRLAATQEQSKRLGGVGRFHLVATVPVPPVYAFHPVRKPSARYAWKGL